MLEKRCTRKLGVMDFGVMGLRATGLVLALFLGGPAWADLRAEPKPSPWVVVDAEQQTITVMDRGRPLETFKGVAFGSAGVGHKVRRGDEITPRGEFRVGWINPGSRFRLFFGLDYPNLDHAERAYREGRIDRSTFVAIRDALLAGRTPSQGTPLGGYIGIHGLGGADPEVHALFDWTQGCVAVDNHQIDRLSRWLKPGMRVEIR